MALKIILDTNAYRDFCEAGPGVVDYVRKAEKIFLPFITVAELKAGFLYGTKSLENEKVLAAFLARPRVVCIYPDDETANHYARLYVQLRRQGTPIPANDLWISALCEQHGAYLVSRDRHFDHIPQLLRAKLED